LHGDRSVIDRLLSAFDPGNGLGLDLAGATIL
jgi:hypothetical protein